MGERLAEIFLSILLLDPRVSDAEESLRLFNNQQSPSSVIVISGNFMSVQILMRGLSIKPSCVKMDEKHCLIIEHLQGQRECHN